MSEHKTVVAEYQAESATLGRYVTGFVGSVGLTLLAYFLVTQHVYSRPVIIGVISGLAIAQFLLQLVFFLHIGEERNPRWKLLVLVFMVSIVLLLVFGSIWIMNNLNYRMTPEQMQHYLKSQDAL